MPRNRLARKEFFANYVNVLFMVLSLGQGLAFQDLAQKSREVVIAAYGQGTPTLVSTVLFVLIALAVLIRILQTYLTVALDYGPEFVTLHDVLLIFVIGLLEAFLFNQLDLVGGIDPNKTHSVNIPAFWLWLTILGAVASLPYLGNVSKVAAKGRIFLSQRDVVEEQILQRANAIFMILLAGVAYLGHVRSHIDPPGSWNQICLQVLAIGILVLTTQVSLSSTFGIRAYFEVSEPDMSLPHVSGLRRTKVSWSVADQNDVSFITKNLVASHQKLLSEIFGVSEDRVEEIVHQAVNSPASTENAWSPLSYQHWIVFKRKKVRRGHNSEEDQSREAVGAILVHMSPETASKCNYALGPMPNIPKWAMIITRYSLANRFIKSKKISGNLGADYLGKAGVERLEHCLKMLFDCNPRQDSMRFYFPFVHHDLSSREPELGFEIMEEVLSTFGGQGRPEIYLIDSPDAFSASLVKNKLTVAHSLPVDTWTEKIVVWREG